MSADLIPTDGRTFLRHHQRAELEQEREQLQAQLQSRHVQDKGAVMNELRKRERQLAGGTPPELPPAIRDALAKEEVELRDELSSSMLSEEEMRKSPTGAVGRLLAWEQRYKPKVLRWKNLRIALEPDNPDPDLANLENFRPHSRPTDPSMHSAQITGQTFSFPSEAYKANYDRAFGAKSEEDVAALETRLAEVESLLAQFQAEPRQATRKKKAPSKKSAASDIELS